jgi:hypothetical protein
MWTPLSLLLLAAAANRLPPTQAPEIHAWFWTEREFQPEGYRDFVDLIADHSNFGLMTTSLRTPQREIVFPETHDQIKRAVAYAHQRGLRVAFDLDVRLARGTFLKRYPAQQQWMLRVRGGRKTVSIEPQRLTDHMTGGGGEYEVLHGRLLGVYRRRADNSIEDACAAVKVDEESARRVAVRVDEAAGDVIVAAAFEYRTPDVFAPALIAFQDAIYAQYRDVPLDGGMKDEWGFPPVYGLGPRGGDFWYSEPLARAYREAGGGDFLRDCVLMANGSGGGAEARAAAANRYLRLILTRNAEIERAFYDVVKRTYGPQAFVGTHATWGIMPSGDAFKNGYDWWQARRDYGQTDEDFPIPLRTSLAKKMGQPLWFNQYYNSDVEPYFAEIWRDARAGGRVNFHPLYPTNLGWDGYRRLLDSPVARAESRIRLLNFVTRAPLDCPVAVVFGHAAALNWLGPHFGDLGIDFADELGKAGFPADVIPSTEIENGSLRLLDDGQVAYGAQRYRALVFLNTLYEPAGTLVFLERARASRTAVFVRGNGVDPSPGRVAQFLKGSYTAHYNPPDLARLTDGTCVLARGEKNPGGDPIEETFYCGNVKATVRATGVLAIRFVQGKLHSLAASELRSVEADGFHLELAVPLDVALWSDAEGRYHGVVQGAGTVPEALPEALRKLTPEWLRLETR